MINWLAPFGMVRSGKISEVVNTDDPITAHRVAIQPTLSLRRFCCLATIILGLATEAIARDFMAGDSSSPAVPAPELAQAATARRSRAPRRSAGLPSSGTIIPSAVSRSQNAAEIDRNKISIGVIARGEQASRCRSGSVDVKRGSARQARLAARHTRGTRRRSNAQRRRWRIWWPGARALGGYLRRCRGSSPVQVKAEFQTYLPAG
jgi:hypothetical protein